jgi:gentisate 1,2-dioxygenase
MSTPKTAPETDDLQRYYARIGARDLAPLWERLADLLPAEPRVRALPHRWNYAALRPLLLESARLIGADEAERRVLILENPALAGESAITDTLFAGLQLIMPGERAPPHRHTPAALRFILESRNAYTTVDGEVIPMAPGDFIITPSWAWHGHGHDGDEPVVWLDVLDLPAVRALGPRFAERAGGPAPRRAASDSLYRYGMNMAPAARSAGSRSSPLRYPYSRCREVLEHSRRHAEPDPCFGSKMEYIDPGTGASAMPTISAFLQLLPAGFETAAYRTTESIVYCVVEGRGRLRIQAGAGNAVYDYEPNDILAVPCWNAHAFSADEESVLFSATDKAVQTRLGLWREQRGSRSGIGPE